MSKVVHLSDDAHNKAKAFCKQHGLKMSDWVADLITEAVVTGRTEPGKAPPPRSITVTAAPVMQAQMPVTERIMAPPPPPPPMAAPVHHGPPKKKLERFEEKTNGNAAAAAAAESDGVPPWAAPPFWARAQSK